MMHRYDHRTLIVAALNHLQPVRQKAGLLVAHQRTFPIFEDHSESSNCGLTLVPLADAEIRWRKILSETPADCHRDHRDKPRHRDFRESLQ
jgi:hypothetical protein